MVGRVGNRSLCVVMVWMPALYSCFVPPYDLGRTAMQLLAWSAIEMNKCRWMKLTCKDVEQDAMQHWFPDWYFPSFTLMQKTSAWPSDCIHADFHVFCSDVKKWANKLFQWTFVREIRMRNVMRIGHMWTRSYYVYVHICGLWIHDTIRSMLLHVGFLASLLSGLPRSPLL